MQICWIVGRKYATINETTLLKYTARCDAYLLNESITKNWLGILMRNKSSKLKKIPFCPKQRWWVCNPINKIGVALALIKCVVCVHSRLRCIPCASASWRPQEARAQRRHLRQANKPGSKSTQVPTFSPECCRGQSVATVVCRCGVFIIITIINTSKVKFIIITINGQLYERKTTKYTSRL